MFGDATYHGATIPQISMSSLAKEQGQGDQQQEESDSVPDPLSVLCHYGGSDRTVDGGKKARGLKQGQTIPRRKRSHQQTTIRTKGTSAAAAAAAAAVESDENSDDILKKEVDIHDDDSDDDNDDSGDEFKLGKPVVVPPKRNRAPRRSVSTKKISYGESSSSSEKEEDDADEDEQSQSEEEKSRKLKPLPRKRKATSAASTKPVISIDTSDEDDCAEKSETKQLSNRVGKKLAARTISKVAINKKNLPTKTQIIHVGDSEDDGERVESDKVHVRSTSRSRSRRASSEKATYVEVPTSDEEEKDEEELSRPTKKQTKAAAAAKPKPAAAHITQEEGDNASKPEPSSSEEEPDDDDDYEATIKTTRKRSATAAKKATATKSAATAKKPAKAANATVCSVRKTKNTKTAELAKYDNIVDSDDTETLLLVEPRAMDGVKKQGTSNATDVNVDNGAGDSKKRYKSSPIRVGGEKEALKTPSPSPSKFKRRRTTSSLKKKPRSIMDLANDDDFAFLG